VNSQRAGRRTVLRSTTPATAPPQTTPKTTQRAVPSSSSRANGVYVPAMRMKIIEWSSRCMTVCERPVHEPRWKAAEVPNSSATLTA
jgi:hypothetical protein